MIKQPKPLKINEFILSCPRFALSLHKKSCISAYRSSKLGDSALDLHYLCTRKAASRHTAQASLAILPPICIIFAQEKLHLGIPLKQAWRFCSRFALSLHKKSCISKYFMPDGQGEQLNIFQEQTIIYRKYDSFFQNSITKRYCYRS